MAIKHIVMFRFEESTSQDEVDSIRQALLDLPDQIDEIKDYELGVDLVLPAGQNHPLGKNRTLSWSATFDSVQDYQAYDASQAHQDFLGKLRPIVDKTSRAAIQYELDE